MSRSKHTDPAPIRAARRLRLPGQTRGAGDLSARRVQGLARKERGGVLEPAAGPCEVVAGRGARVRTEPPSPGCLHPADAGAVKRFLDTLGPLGRYGLRTVELRRRPRTGGVRESLTLGAYRAPGTVILYEQPCSPWLLPGRLAPADTRRLEQAGASVEVVGTGLQTVVTWPPGTLQAFVLRDVLLHELGHHCVQQYTGKRAARVVRTRHHEARAAALALRLLPPSNSVPAGFEGASDGRIGTAASRPAPSDRVQPCHG